LFIEKKLDLSTDMELIDVFCTPTGTIIVLEGHTRKFLGCDNHAKEDNRRMGNIPINWAIFIASNENNDTQK
jgi:hypothetical protein